MQDGLLVAAHLPPGLNGDGIAAFLPQMHTRMSQYAKELKLGGTENITIIIDHVPLSIFKVGNVYFAAVGAPGNLCRNRISTLSPRISDLKASNRAMAIINQATKELQVKIVFYGPGMGGKTTNLIKVHENIQTAKEKGKMVSLATSSDRTLFFDFLPIEAVAIKGFRTKFQLYTVPGQVIYNTTRQLVLRGVDGIVFVADSQYDKMAENVESFANLEENLRTLKLNLADIPYVVQYNKRDLPNVAPVEYMEFLLNNREVQVPSFTAVASQCEGVFETLNMITRMLLHKFINESKSRSG
jgi:mutual gliding-motility protein MglA